MNRLNLLMTLQIFLLTICLKLVRGQYTDEEIEAFEKLSPFKITLMIIIVIVGVLGNIFVILLMIVLKEYKKSITHWYILNLAFADGLLLLSVPFQISEDWNFSFVLPEGICKLQKGIFYSTYYASVLFLMHMSICRYLAVCHSFSNTLKMFQRRKVVITIITWIASLLLSIPAMRYSFISGFEPHCRCLFHFENEKDPTEFCNEYIDYPEYFDDCVQIARQSAFPGYCNPAPSGAPYDETFSSGEQSYETSASGKRNNESFGSGERSNETFGFGEQKNETFEYEEQYNDFDSNYNEDNGIHPACQYWNQPVGLQAFIALNISVMFLLPIIVMIACYGFIIQKMASSHVPASNLQSSSSFTQSSAINRSKSKREIRSKRNRRRVTLISAALVICFTVCWLPTYAVHLAKFVGIKSSKSYNCTNLRVLTELLAYLNSAINPILYTFIGHNFRERMKSFTSRRTSISQSSSKTQRTRFVTQRKDQTTNSKTETAETKLCKSIEESKNNVSEDSLSVCKKQSTQPYSTS